MVRLDMLQQPITIVQEERQEFKSALDNVQGNILRGHGRKHSVNLFLRFQTGLEAQVREQMRCMAEDKTITSALAQSHQSKDQLKEPNSLFCSVFLSAEGYRYLDARLLKRFPKEFQGGMQGARARWQEPGAAWAKADTYDFHAMILLAQADPQILRKTVQDMRQRFASVLQYPVQDCREEWGKGMQDHHKPVEHFGFVDNLSQPLFFQKDIEKHPPRDGEPAWDPSAGPSLVLVPDPHGGRNACGSYLVFLKLEQNPRGFARKVRELATRLGLTDDKVQAFIMGRFRDGTPVTLRDTPGMQGSLNDFSFFASDRDGTKCPYHAHIRKVNPRDDTASSRERLIVRRGITYGERTKEPKDHPSPEEMPKDGVGLLFMCYQRNIKKQFEALQFVQANNANFFQENTGIDPIIGRARGGEPPQKWPTAWDAPRRDHEPFDFGSFVTIKGGEYFFAPSMSFLKNL